MPARARAGAKNQAQYLRMPDGWMLSAFVLPVDQFASAKQLLSEFDPLHPLRVSALGAKTENAGAFREALARTNVAVRSLSAHNVDLVSVTQLEMFLPRDVDAPLLNEAGSILGTLPVFGKRRLIAPNKPSPWLPKLIRMLTPQHLVTSCAPAA